MVVSENNLSNEEQNALLELTSNPNIVIQKENNVNTFVIFYEEF